MATFTEIKNGLDEIAGRSVANKKRMQQAKDFINQAVVDLSAMQTSYSQLVADIDTAATANPDNVAFQGAKQEKDELVSDFLALKATADSLQTAVNGIDIN